jgi:hypothetical protein
MSVSGGGVSTTSGGGADLRDIISGGPGFAERLARFQEAAAHAEEVRAHARQLLAEAEATRRDAHELLAQAQRDATEAKAKNVEADRRMAILCDWTAELDVVSARFEACAAQFPVAA